MHRKKQTQQPVNNLVELLDASAAKFPKKIAIVFGAKKITYAELAGISKRLASALRNLGLRESEKIALWVPNCPEYIYSFFAALRLGAVVVPINTMFKREEARYVVEDSGARIMICSVDKSQDSENIFSRLDTVRELICLSCPEGKKDVWLDYNRLIETNQELSEGVDIKDIDLAEIVYTSGTTGRAKGACLTHKNLISNVKDCAKAISFSQKDCAICILPLFHSFSSTVCMLLPLYKGAKIVIMRTVRPFKRVVRAVFKHKVTIFAGVPSLYGILSEVKLSKLKLFIVRLRNPVRLFISGAAALPFSIWEKFEKKYKRVLLQGYGLTEASPVVSLNYPDDKKGGKAVLRKPESVGLPLPSVKVKVVDDEGRSLVNGEVGELLVKGANVMQGYYNLREETSKALKDGWLFTGDLAKLDEQGFIYIMGRSKEMINVRGFNVYPREIEDILYKHPQVKEAAVVGVSHRHRGEVPVAFVVTRAPTKESDILHYLRANLAAYKTPLKIIFKEALPKNPTGKVLKRELHDQIVGIFK